MDEIILDSTARHTLNLLGNTLRMEKFVLRAVLQKKKEIEKVESDTREKIRQLVNRVQWEIDKASEAYRKSQEDKSDK